MSETPPMDDVDKLVSRLEEQSRLSVRHRSADEDDELFIEAAAALLQLRWERDFHADRYDTLRVWANEQMEAVKRQRDEALEALRPFAEAVLVERIYAPEFTPEQRARCEADDGLCARVFTNGQVRAASRALGGGQ